jgi:hypothetical protein
MECFVWLPQGYIGISRPANQITFIYEPTVSLHRIPKTFSIDILTAKIFHRERGGEREREKVYAPKKAFQPRNTTFL